MRKNEDHGLTALYRRTFPPVARMVQQLGGDLPAARDLFHDALIIYLEKKRNRSLNIRTSAEAYLIGMVKILWIKKFKKDRHYLLLEEMTAYADIPEDFYPAAEKWSGSLLNYLKSAGKRCMQLLQAFYYDQWSMHEIAEEFNYKTPHSATVQKYKCLEKMRAKIKRSDIYEEVIA